MFEETESKTKNADVPGNLNGNEKSIGNSIASLAMSVIGFVASIVGVIFFFTGGTNITCICAVISIADSVIQRIWGDQNNLITEIIAVIIGAVVSFFLPGGFLTFAALALCIETVVFTLFGWIGVLIAAIFIR